VPVCSSKSLGKRRQGFSVSPTAGKRPLPAMRFYGPADALNNKTFKLPDFELAS
jgi:hypothetical protein